MHRATSINDENVLLNVERDLVFLLLFFLITVQFLLYNFVIPKLWIHINLVLANFASVYNCSSFLCRHKIRHDRNWQSLWALRAFFPQPTGLLGKVISDQEDEIFVWNILPLLFCQTHLCTVTIAWKSDLNIVINWLNSVEFFLTFYKDWNVPDHLTFMSDWHSHDLVDFAQ